MKNILFRLIFLSVLIGLVGSAHGAQINLQSVNGQWFCAEGGGGQAVYANRSAASGWETFTLNDLNGGNLESGDSITLQAANGQYFCAEGGGGGQVVANRNAASTWETFRIYKMNGGGSIGSGDQVSIQADNGQYWCAEGGGGDVVNANRSSPSGWETFTIITDGSGGGGAPQASISPSSTSVGPGQVVTFTVSASCASGLNEIGLEEWSSPTTPQWNRGILGVSGTSASYGFTWSTSTPGTYYFGGYAWNADRSQLTRTSAVVITVAGPSGPPAVQNTWADNTSVTVGQTTVLHVLGTSSGGILHYVNLDEVQINGGDVHNCYWGAGDNFNEDQPVTNGWNDLGFNTGTYQRDIHMTFNRPGTYRFAGAARDVNGNYVTYESTGGGVPTVTITVSAAPDTTPPSIPTGLTASLVTGNSFTLSWAPSSDNVGVAAYQVAMNGTSQPETSATSFAFQGLSAGAAYSVQVRARDAASNWSSWSSVYYVNTVAQNPGGGGQSAWQDVNGDGILDEIYPQASGRVQYSIAFWQPSTFVDWFMDLGGGQQNGLFNFYQDASLYDGPWFGAQSLQSWYINIYYGQSMADIRLDLNLDDPNYSYRVYMIWNSGGQKVATLVTPDLVFNTGNIQTWRWNNVPIDSFPGHTFSLVRLGKPVGGLSIGSSAGGTLGALTNGVFGNITVPGLGTVPLSGIAQIIVPGGASPVFSVKDTLDKIIQAGPQVVWDIWDLVTNQHITVGGVTTSLDIGVDLSGHILLGPKLDDSAPVYFEIFAQKANLGIINPLGIEMPPKKKLTDGEVVAVNADDDNNNGVADKDDTGAVEGEHDLVQLVLHKVQGSTSGLTYKLHFGGGKIALWSNPNKTNRIQSDSTTFDVSNDTAVYVEGLNFSDDDNGEIVRLDLYRADTKISDDSVKLIVAKPIFALMGNGATGENSLRTYLAPIKKDSRIDPYMIHGTEQSANGPVGRWYSVSIWKTKALAKSALATQGAIVVYDGHSGYGIGFSFSSNLPNISAFMKLGGECVGIDWVDMRGPAENHPNFSVDESEYGDDPTTTELYDPWRVYDANGLQTPQGPAATNHYYLTNHPGAIHQHLFRGSERLYDYHIAGGAGFTARLIVKVGATDMPEKRWDVVFINGCNSGQLYSDTFNHGTFFYTFQLCSAAGTSSAFVQGVISGDTNNQLRDRINRVEPVNDYHVF